jgi:hypothetical protein
MGGKKSRQTIVAEYINPHHNRVADNLWRVSNVWRIEGSRLVSDVGEEIVLLPVKEV